MGEMVAEIRTKKGEPISMRQNPQSAVVGLGHSHGTVTLWSPNMPSSLAEIMCHPSSPVRAVSFERQQGVYMVTCGADSRMKVWDLRTYKLVSDYFTPEAAASAAISQTGLLAVGCVGGLVQVWKDWQVEKQKEPYMKHSTDSLGRRDGRGVCEIKFAPFEDFLGVGTKGGF